MNKIVRKMANAVKLVPKEVKAPPAMQKAFESNLIPTAEAGLFGRKKNIVPNEVGKILDSSV